MRQRIADAWMGLQIMRYNALRTLSSRDPALSREATITKIYWATWHRELGKLFMDVIGPVNASYPVAKMMSSNS